MLTVHFTQICLSQLSCVAICLGFISCYVALSRVRCGRGSLGFGEDSVQALPGSIGTLDVQDCITALDTAIAKGAPELRVLRGGHSFS